MRLTCPSCGAIHSAEAWQSNAQARQCLQIVAELPTGVARHALSYLALFRTQGGRGLQWAKALRLLSELRDLVNDRHIQWDRSPARPNNPRAWGLALEQMIAQPPKRLPLTSHGYLHRVAYQRADEMDQKTEQRRNAAERRGNPHQHDREPTQGPQRLDMNWMHQIRKKNMEG